MTRRAGQSWRASFAARVALLLAGVCWLGTARADDPVSGAALYAANCQTNCHGSSPLTSNSNKIYNGRNARAAIDAAINNVGDMKSLRAAFPSGGSAIADIAAYLGNTPTSLTFAATPVGSTAPTQAVTVYASLKSGNAIAGLSVAAGGEFSRAGGTCATAVATGTSCTVVVAFMPNATGARSGTLTIAHGNTLTPITIRLAGTGSGTAAPAASVAPTSLSFASTPIGTTSAAQNVTLTNNGSAALVLSSVTVGASSDFVISGGTCGAGTSLAVGAACTVSVAFRPASGSVGARSGTLTIAHNAAGGSTTLTLGGIAAAAAAPVATLTPSLAFGNVNLGATAAAQTATLANTGTAPLVLGTLSTASSEFAIGAGTCSAGASIAPGASCSVGISFTPTAAGARSASLVVTHNAGAGQSVATLSGTGVSLNPVAVVSPATLAFSQTVNTTSVAQTVTLSNTGTAPLLLGALSMTGGQAAEFQIAAGTTCVAGGSVAANSSCLVRLTLTPAATGARAASLTIAHNAAGSPSTIALSGTGTASAQPAIALNATALAFGAQTIGSASAAQSAVVTNSGAAPLVIASIALTGTAAADFAASGSCAANAVLAPGASCTAAFAFTPGAVGTRSATAAIASNAANGNAILSLSGTGVAIAAPAVALAPLAMDFGSQSIAVASAARAATLTNSGSGPLAIASIAASVGFSVTNNCGASLAAGASCTLAISFTPAAAGAASGSVSVASNASGSPHRVTLGGNGVVGAPVLAWSPPTGALAFGNASVGAAQTIASLTLANLGPGDVTLQSFAVSGAQASDFALANGGSCALGMTLSQGATCTFAVSFQPGGVGPRSATLHVASSGGAPPDVTLAGNGAAMAQASVGVVPAALSFEVGAVAAPASAQTLTLQSTGSAVLRVIAMRVAAGSFTIEPAAAGGCPAAPFDLMPAQSCAVAVAWSSLAPGTETGALAIESNAAAAPVEVPIAAVRATASAAPTGAEMSNVGAGGCSIARTDTLSDPTLWLLVALAAGVLWRRRVERRRAPIRFQHRNRT